MVEELRKAGELLANVPADPSDGAWPHRAVRQMLGAIRRAEVDRGFLVGVSNARGATTRGLRDGGEQERALAVRYEGWA